MAKLFNWEPLYGLLLLLSFFVSNSFNDFMDEGANVIITRDASHISNHLINRISCNCLENVVTHSTNIVDITLFASQSNDR